MAVTVMEMVGRLVGDTSDFDRSMAGAGKTATTTGQHIRRAAFVAASAITGGLVVAAKVGWDEFQKGQLVTAQTNTMLESTGNTANVTADHIRALGVDLMKKSGIDDLAIRSGENLLGTFANVRNEVGKGRDIFDQATRAALDMSVATGKDLTGSFKGVARALNDPIKGLTLLTRQGIRFTDEEKAQIATMVEHNNIIGAQQLILAKLNTAYGGSADISGTVAGKMAIAREQFKNVAETLVATLLPAFTAILAPVASLLGFLGRHTTTTKVLVAALAGLAVVLYAVSAGTLIFNASMKIAAVATKAWAAAQWLLNAALDANPIGIVVVALAALAVGLVVAYKKSETFRNIVSAAVNFVKHHWLLLIAVLTGGLIPAIVLVIQHFRRIKDVFITAVVSILHGIAQLLYGFARFVGAMSIIPGIGDKFQNLAEKIRGAAGAVDNLADRVNNLHSKTIHINAVVSGLGYVAALQEHIALLQSKSVHVGAGRQHGGPVMPGGVYRVGEAGEETLVMGRSGGYVIPHSGGRGGGGGGVVNNFYIGPGVDRHALQNFANKLGPYLDRRVAL